jgi:hypothetical protein
MNEPLTTQEMAESEEPDVDQRLGIPPQRLLLLDALRERDARLAAIYEAVVRIIGAADVPDQLSLAAHAMRELMERLPLAFDLPIDEKSRLFNRLDELERALAQAQTTSACRTTDGWQGEIDSPVAKVLAAVEELVDDRHRFWSSRSATAVELMNRLEPTLARRSAPLVNTDADVWLDLRRYFESVSHHHHVFDSLQTSASEFGDRVRTIEVLLLNKLRPPTAADFEEIDGLMSQFLGAHD